MGERRGNSLVARGRIRVACCKNNFKKFGFVIFDEVFSSGLVLVNYYKLWEEWITSWRVVLRVTRDIILTRELIKFREGVAPSDLYSQGGGTVCRVMWTILVVIYKAMPRAILILSFVNFESFSTNVWNWCYFDHWKIEAGVAERGVPRCSRLERVFAYRRRGQCQFGGHW